MFRIATVLALSAFTGVFLAFWPASWVVRPGLVTLALMVVAAWAVRRHWHDGEVGAPDSTERALWLSMAGSATVGAHLVASLFRIGPEFDLHSAAGHRLGVDSWTLVLGGAMAYAIARDPHPRLDERDRLIEHRGVRWAFRGLTAALLSLAVLLGFEVMPVIERLSSAMLAHIVLALIILSWLVGNVVQLHAYSLDHAVEARDR